MTQLIVPRLGESITAAVVAKWLKQVGEPVAQDEPVADLETDKVSVSLPSPEPGVLVEQRVPAGATVKVGEVIGVVGTAIAEARSERARPIGPTTTTVAQVPTVVPPSQAPATGDVPAPRIEPAPREAPVAAIASAPPPVEESVGHLSPSQRRALREQRGNPAATPAPPTGNGHAARPAPAPSPAPTEARADEELVPMTPLRKRIAERLVAAQHTAAVLTTFNEIDLSAVIALRARFQEPFTAKHGVKLGFMSFFARAVVETLKEFPGLNAEVRGDAILYKHHYDLGIAVGGGRGLVVPVVRNVDRLSLAAIERAVAELGRKAKENKLTLEDLAGGTFSITNGGVYGSLLSTPLLNLPQTGILGMHNIVRRPIAVTVDGTERIEVRPMMYVALSYDHRVVDGREAVQFLVAIKQRLESPERLMFEI